MSEWRLCCRLCANRKPDNYTNVFYHEALNVSNSYMTLVQVIEKCFSVKISPEDDFSKVLCSQCLRLINDIVDFSELVIKVQEMFNHMIYDAEQSQLNVDANDDDKKCTIMTGEQSPTCSRISETSIHIKDEIEEEEEENIEGIKELGGEEHVYESSANQEDGSCLNSDHSVKDEKFDYVDSQKECNECAKEFESFDYYHEHLELIHGKRKSRDPHFDAKVRKVNYEELCELRSNAGDISLNLSCNDCVQQFETFHAYKIHMESMHGKGRREKWKCPKCNKTVMTSFNLKRHLLTHIRKKRDTERDEKHFVSEVSEMCLRNQNSLKIYMQRHAPFECGICKKRFKNPARLKVHGEIHDSHKHICNICGQQLNTRCALKGHMLVHSDLYPTNMSKAFDEEFHDVLSRLLRNYPKLWRHRAGSIKGQYQELAEKVSVELHRRVSAQKVQTTLGDVRRRLLGLEKGWSYSMRSCAYLWYAQELGYMRAAKALSKSIEQKEGLLGFEKVVVEGQSDKKNGMATAKTTDTSNGQFEPPFEKNYAGPCPSVPFVEKPPNAQECMQISEEECDGPSTSAQAAQMANTDEC
uniref:ZAD domain-containing protein n=1 Tax=Glossina pallidipes TaxID=7398 RepID=A0A1B0AAL8_GLOPL